MLNNLFLLFGDNADKLLSLIIIIASGLFIRLLLEICGQAWIKTKAHTATLLILPIITFVITNVIAGNIALSLGMVGALSIVRFRNPVRSPLELSTYFAAITMGISASVSLSWLIFLVLSILIVVIVLAVINFLSIKFFSKQIFISSFAEGNSLSTLTIKSSNQIEMCEKHVMLQSKHKFENECIYSFASDNFEDLRSLEAENEIQSNCLSTELRR
ncbi:DUF4956 domain-containing protein [Gammaproteobacteria bacterium]|nr:DUF4956 domain-containing protein [Gammaproteobacteria bacterium]